MFFWPSLLGYGLPIEAGVFALWEAGRACEGIYVIDTGTSLATGKAESSRVQFRELFALHEPALFAFSDSMLEAFGRGSIAKVTIYCPVEVISAS